MHEVGLLQMPVFYVNLSPSHIHSFIAPFGQMTLTTMLDLVRDKSQSMRLAAATW